MSPPTSGPTIHARVSTVWSERVRVRQLLVSGDEVRQAGVDGRSEEAGRDPGDRRERDDRPPGCRRTAAREHAETDEVGDDHEPSAREPVDERPEQEPDQRRSAGSPR